MGLNLCNHLHLGELSVTDNPAVSSWIFKHLIITSVLTHAAHWCAVAKTKTNNNNNKKNQIMLIRYILKHSLSLMCCINAPVHRLSIIPILPLGGFSAIKTKAKASVRLGVSGEIPLVKTHVDINWAVTFPSRLKSWILGSWLKHSIHMSTERTSNPQDVMEDPPVCCLQVLAQNTGAFKSLAPCWIELKNEEGICFIEYRDQVLFPVCEQAF